MNTIKVRFSCEKCGIDDMIVEVPARMDPDKEDVCEYVEKVIGTAVAMAHSRVSPKYTSNVMKHLKIPLLSKDNPDYNTSWIGKATNQIPPRT